MPRARTVDEYVDLVKQALFEVEELRAAVEYDMEYMGGALGFLEELEAQVRALYGQMERGEYAFEDRDLPFMAIAEHQDDRLLPFKSLLRSINETHRHGLDVHDD